MSEAAQQLRQQVLEHLRLMASKDEALKYQANVPIANVVDELISIWFDDLGFGELDDTRLQSFMDAFSQEELAALVAFTDDFETKLESLPNTLDELLASDAWSALSTRAGQLAELLT